VFLARCEEIQQPSVIRPSGFRPPGRLASYEKSARSRTVEHETAPLQNLQGIITAADLHFVVNYENVLLMNVDPQKHRGVDDGGSVESHSCVHHQTTLILTG
jgi:hypothetical protein